MKNLFAVAFLVCSSASFAEQVVVTAPRIPNTPGPDAGVGIGGGPGKPLGSPDLELPKKPSGEGGGTIGSAKSMGGWTVGDKVVNSVVDGVITKILSRTISGEGQIFVQVETPDHLKVTVWVSIKASSSTTK